MKSLLRISCLHLFRELLDNLLLIQQLKNAEKIKLFKFKSAEILELDILNTEQEKLAEARDVTI